MKYTKRIVSFLLALFLSINMVSVSVFAAGRVKKTGIAFIDASTLRLRSGPSTSAKTLDYGSRNEVVVLLGKTGEWYHVIYNLQEGYMHKTYLDTTTREDAELGYGKLNGDKVNVRSGPGTGYQSLTRASLGDKAYIIGINNQWFKVIYGNYVGYIRSDYLDLTEIPYENVDSNQEPLFFVRGKSTGVTPSPAALKGSSQDAQAIIATAKKYIGSPYLWGGITPAGFDCSGYMQYVFKIHGISLPRTSVQQSNFGTAVSKKNLKPGDLVFFNTSGKGVSHVGMYIGNNQFIHSSSSKGVTISSLSSSYWSARYLSARRVL